MNTAPAATWSGVSVTGHRDLTAAQLAWLRPELDRVLMKLRDDHGCTDAATGMALGADTEFGWSALFVGLKLHAHVPFPQQPGTWPAEQQATYARLLERCTSKVVYGPSFDKKWYFVRNDGLLDFAEENAGVLVAVWDPKQRESSGTFDTVKKAARRRLPVIHFDVAALRVHAPGCSCVASLAGRPILGARQSDGSLAGSGLPSSSVPADAGEYPSATRRYDHEAPRVYQAAAPAGD